MQPGGLHRRYSGKRAFATVSARLYLQHLLIYGLWCCVWMGELLHGKFTMYMCVSRYLTAGSINCTGCADRRVLVKTVGEPYKIVEVK